MDVGLVALGPKVNREVLHRPLGRQEIPHLRRPSGAGAEGIKSTRPVGTTSLVHCRI
jgi:hypothetical protein